VPKCQELRLDAFATIKGGRADEERKSFSIVIVFVAAEKYEINRYLVAGHLDGYDNRTNGSNPVKGWGLALSMATQLGAFVTGRLRRSPRRNRNELWVVIVLDRVVELTQSHLAWQTGCAGLRSSDRPSASSCQGTTGC
jgi:hypothetical protein